MSKKRNAQRLIKFLSRKLKKKGYSDNLIKSIIGSERFRLGGFKLTQSNVKGQAIKVASTHKTYSLRVFGDKGNCNSEKVLHTPTLSEQRKAYFTVNPTGVFNGERKERYKVGNRESGFFNGFLNNAPTAKTPHLPYNEPLRGEPIRGSYTPYRETP